MGNTSTANQRNSDVLTYIAAVDSLIRKKEAELATTSGEARKKVELILAELRRRRIDYLCELSRLQVDAHHAKSQ